MTSDAPNDDGTSAQTDRLIASRQHLEQVVATVLREAADAHKLDICGTDELPAALSALESADYLDTEEDAARWVARAFTAHPTGLLGAGATDVELALGGAVMMLRVALADLDEAKR